MTETYNFSSGLKKLAFGAIGIGLLMVVLGGIFGSLGNHEPVDAHGATHNVEVTDTPHETQTGHTDHDAVSEDAHATSSHGGSGVAARIWASMLICAYYFIGIGLGITFLMAAHQIGYGGWHVLIKRIPEAMAAFVPVGGVFLLIILAGMFLHAHHLYHWTAEGIMDPNSPNYDSVIAGKEAFLNVPFYALRIVAYIVLWTGTIYLVRNISRKEDEIGVSQTYQRSSAFN